MYQEKKYTINFVQVLTLPQTNRTLLWYAGSRGMAIYLSQ